MSQKIPGRTEIETRKTNHMHSTNNANDKMANINPLNQDGAFHPGPVYRPLPQPIKQNMTHAQSSQSSNINNNNLDINFDFEKNSPLQESIMSETFQRPDKSFFQEPKELRDLINKGNIIHKYLPKQTDIDRILEIIQRKVLKGTHLFHIHICIRMYSHYVSDRICMHSNELSLHILYMFPKTVANENMQ